MKHFKGMPGREDEEEDEDEALSDEVLFMMDDGNDSLEEDDDEQALVDSVFDNLHETDDSKDEDFQPSSDDNDTVYVPLPYLAAKLAEKRGEASTSKEEDPPAGESDEEDEDEVVRAIVAAKKIKRAHPPDIVLDEFMSDISLHPKKNIIATGLLSGDVKFFQYTNEENKEIASVEVHADICRDIEFNEDGDLLLSSSVDRCIMITDTNTMKLKQFYDNAHESKINRLYVLDDNRFASGDEDGIVKIWDLRQKRHAQHYKEMEQFVADMISNDERRYLVCCSGESVLTTLDLTAGKMLVQTEDYKEDLNCMGLFKHETKLIVGSLTGKMFMFNWGEFGLHSDQFPGPKKTGITCILPITEYIAAIAYDDGVIRASHVYPQRYLGVVGQHEIGIDALDISFDGEYIASSEDKIVKFWNIRYFEDIHVDEKKKVKDKNKDMKNNLPSSKVRNASDFFSDLAD